ncbi:putative phage abortive infection protein [Agrobacterium sp. 10MFCol1.1]|uniref:putative phage abortive infection protein n=1 Tax=Agrobacterium sp. 10MFCol1.1 TaxID=1150775 RepID=UPI000372F526|nr:putative phage abortive infection protein [Agrobacterium sp. 10MFCol1.1]
MKKSWVILLGTTAALIWAAWVAQKWIFAMFGADWSVTNLGAWGDTFGALNALFSAFAFIAVLFTLKQQRDELGRQQKQILAAERDQHVQRFEQTFYELLRLLREARSDVRFSHTDQYKALFSGPMPNSASEFQGAEAFAHANFEMIYCIGKLNPATQAELAEQLAETYMTAVHLRYESSFAPYYRLLYTILLRIHEDSVLIDKEKHRFGNLLRSQLTSHEVALCCYNGLSAVSGSFKQLLLEFRIGKYLPEHFGKVDLKRVYDPKLFSGRDENP